MPIQDWFSVLGSVRAWPPASTGFSSHFLQHLNAKKGGAKVPKQRGNFGLINIFYTEKLKKSAYLRRLSAVGLICVLGSIIGFGFGPASAVKNGKRTHYSYHWDC